MGWGNHREETKGPQGCGVSARAPLHHGQGRRYSRTIPKENPREKPEDPDKLNLPHPSTPRGPPSPMLPRRGKWTSSLLARAESLIRFRHTHPCTLSSKFRAMEIKPWLTQRPEEKQPQLQSRVPAQSHHLLRCWRPGRAINCAST